MLIKGYEFEKWEFCNLGKKAIAKKGGKRYFLKQYKEIVAPKDDGTYSEEVFACRKKEFDSFYNRRITVNYRIRKIAASGGNIIIPCEEFFDENRYVEASEFIDGAVPNDENVTVLSGLPFDDKILLMKTVAASLASIHKQHIIHSDMKLDNLLVVKNGSGKYVAKIIDFDGSYPDDDKPDELMGTLNYMSPELGCYDSDADDCEEMKEKITEKTDIFSLGIIFHQILSGDFPEAKSLTKELQERKDKGRAIYAFEILCNDCELVISPKIKDLRCKLLISEMLSYDPKNRPTANEVLDRLKAPAITVSAPDLDEPFPKHGIMLDKTKLAAVGIVMLKQKVEGSNNKYAIWFSDGRNEVISKEDMLSRGYAKPTIPEGFEAPLTEYGIEFNEDKIKSRGYVSGKNDVRNGVKGYSFYKADGVPKFIRVESITLFGYAEKKNESVVVEDDRPEGFEAPLTEYGIELNEDKIKSRGYVSGKNDVRNGVKGYSFYKADGIPTFLTVKNIKWYGFAKK